MTKRNIGFYAEIEPEIKRQADVLKFRTGLSLADLLREMILFTSLELARSGRLPWQQGSDVHERQERP